MCGILGCVGRSSVTPESIAGCIRGIAALRNRGPDGDRLEKGRDWVLGHTRLKILDLTEHAAQPMRDGLGRWIVFNGEIYNFQDLRRELEAEGVRFQSSGDTQVLSEAFGRWGTGALMRLRGMFAFAWVDPERRELLLVRDRYECKTARLGSDWGWSSIRFGSFRTRCHGGRRTGN